MAAQAPHDQERPDETAEEADDIADPYRQPVPFPGPGGEARHEQQDDGADGEVDRMVPPFNLDGAACPFDKRHRPPQHSKEREDDGGHHRQDPERERQIGQDARKRCKRGLPRPNIRREHESCDKQKKAGVHGGNNFYGFPGPAEQFYPCRLDQIVLEQAGKAAVAARVEKAQQPALLRGVGIRKVENAVLAENETLRAAKAARTDVQHGLVGVDVADSRQAGLFTGFGALLLVLPFAGPVVAAQRCEPAPEAGRRIVCGTEIGALNPVRELGRQHTGVPEPSDERSEAPPPRHGR